MCPQRYPQAERVKGLSAGVLAGSYHISMGGKHQIALQYLDKVDPPFIYQFFRLWNGVEKGFELSVWGKLNQFRCSHRRSRHWV